MKQTHELRARKAFTNTPITCQTSAESNHILELLTSGPDGTPQTRVSSCSDDRDAEVRAN